MCQAHGSLQEDWRENKEQKSDLSLQKFLALSKDLYFKNNVHKWLFKLKLEYVVQEKSRF